ncbi:maltokinase N-terminal cap-like domain-containing protein [Streptomyces yaizuensis]|uniref:1,4-alpha-glucan branching protein n=1 Tax=Streptomyces yaizuensis TaxID=2989713 RepID=A0ABQ5NXI6_9ACTN|nr:1,4-alpha-glucan branching protein [Streptomyces sp. YSPA8]GLF94895.1 1,4-alpha-glucan branching protein [Streptomyces sp. YSPA8]
MAVLHATTMKPTKLELLTAWLPRQSWYEGGAATPELATSGGFRLDDPAGEVGIEIMVVTDTSGPEPVVYLVPMGYRGAESADIPAEGLIGTSEHGVLGTRWIFDGTYDPVVTAQLRALLDGVAVPQHQRESGRTEPTVVVEGAVPADGSEVRINRVLLPVDSAGEPRDTTGTQDGHSAPARLVAGWTGPDGTAVRGVFATAVRG